MRIGIFGGSFDPVHHGHLLIALRAWEQLHLDHVRMIPAAQSPLKPPGTHAAASERLEMLRLATGGTDCLVVDDRELRRGGVSYTVDTLQELRDGEPSAEWFLVVGADSLASLPQWHRPERLLRLATLAVVRRGGQPPLDYGVLASLADAETIARCRAAEIRMPLIEMSSSDLRRRVAEGRTIRFQTPRAVEAYIDSHRLYRPTGP
ncbi:nicotinate-nucleotide adenylyltransferase [Roseimaritima sediminicola]|uniref:nicotinate-nucleotide adenylyltransferase n=1 Tax=Roseimaritima sediminicola TaxID=2662066 RepID=UPI00129832BF|nr:nicotinate-nucleotide adenylyltransferase [Roseimaritima sediminicola]